MVVIVIVMVMLKKTLHVPGLILKIDRSSYCTVGITTVTTTYA